MQIKILIYISSFFDNIICIILNKNHMEKRAKLVFKKSGMPMLNVIKIIKKKLMHQSNRLSNLKYANKNYFKLISPMQ